jgi:hypothetical protein
MKLRIRGNSIRFRLTRGEVEQLAASGEVKETVDFGQSEMTYSLEVAGNHDELRAEFKDGSINVVVPQDRAAAWAVSEQVGIDSSQMTKGGKKLRILIEKDFECLADRPGEDDSDAFPNPRAATAA